MPSLCVCLMYTKKERFGGGRGVEGSPTKKVGRLIGARGGSAEETKKKRSAPGCRSGISSVATSAVA